MANLLKIKELAQEKNIALKDIANEVGITPQALSKLMRLGSTNTDTLERIANKLGVSAAVFFDSPSAGEGQNVVDSPMTISGHHIKGNRLNDSRILEKALNEIAEHRKIIAKSQEHISELTTAVLQLTKTQA